MHIQYIKYVYIAYIHTYYIYLSGSDQLTAGIPQLRILCDQVAPVIGGIQLVKKESDLR